MNRSRNRLRLLPWALCWLGVPAQAAPFDLGDADWALRWDNTVKYSLASRLKGADAALVNAPGGVNYDDGDRNFGKGLISNRLDLLSEADLVWQRRFGVRVSAAAWYDRVYERTNDNPGFAGGAFPNRVTGPANQFAPATRKVHGRNAEWLDAFAFGKFEVGGLNATARLGKHSILWGESLFFGGNAIAGGMMPVDVVKLLSVPNTQFKEAIRPVPQVSGQLQLSANVSLAAYYQFQWMANRLPASGSYFSSVDMGVEGGEALLLPAGVALRQADAKPKDKGQGGVQLKWRLDEVDLGFYAIRFHAKAPQLVPVIDPASSLPGAYFLAYHQGIQALGASASKTFGAFNLAMEASLRHNQDLASTRGADLRAVPGLGPTDNSANPAYAVGKTAHVNLSTLASLGPNGLWKEATLVGEVAWNRLLSVTKNPGALDANGTRDGYGLRVQLEPMYRSVLPGLDVGVPVGLGYAPRGSRPLAVGGPAGAWLPENGGDLTLGLNGVYLDDWRVSLAYTHYYGRAAPQNDLTNAYSWQQTLRDRDFVSVSLRTSF